MRLKIIFAGVVALLLLLSGVYSQEKQNKQSLDEKVKSFLESHKNQWRDLNVPESDGQALYDLIIENGYKKALEIGTSTGRSAIWIAWALSKTGGKLITIEINERRYKQAIKNFDQAGLSEYIDARLANAHDLVPQLEGPFDFVFVDADKDWYTNYLDFLLPKMEEGGCFTAHNVLNTHMRGIPEFVEYVSNHPELETTILHSSRSGISVSYKRSKTE